MQAGRAAQAPAPFSHDRAPCSRSRGPRPSPRRSAGRGPPPAEAGGDVLPPVAADRAPGHRDPGLPRSAALRRRHRRAGLAAGGRGRALGTPQGRPRADARWRAHRAVQRPRRAADDAGGAADPQGLRPVRHAEVRRRRDRLRTGVRARAARSCGEPDAARAAARRAADRPVGGGGGKLAAGHAARLRPRAARAAPRRRDGGHAACRRGVDRGDPAVAGPCARGGPRSAEGGAGSADRPGHRRDPPRSAGGLVGRAAGAGGGHVALGLRGGVHRARRRPGDAVPGRMAAEPRATAAARDRAADRGHRSEPAFNRAFGTTPGQARRGSDDRTGDLR